MRTCPDCKTSVEDESHLCPRCGATLQPENDDKEKKAENEQPTFRVVCPHCGTELIGDPREAGLVYPCPSCGKDVEIPDPSEPSESFAAKPQRMGRCRYCGHAIPFGSNPCPNCGREVKWFQFHRRAVRSSNRRAPQNTDSLLSEIEASRAAEKGFCSFSGRAGKEEFWCLCFVLIVFSLLVGGGVLIASRLESSELAFIFIVLGVILGLPLGVFSWAVQVRRCHDFGWSGWWLLLIHSVPLAPIVLFGFLDGQPGRNRYGPDPRSLRRS